MAEDYFGAPLPAFLRHRHAAHGGFSPKSKTYLAMIACVLQDSPGKRLTFIQLMEKLEEFVTGDRKGFENNIRVCLSASKCFVKIPMFQQMPSCKLNYWQLDHSQITDKMVRRHFREILGQFPELAPRMETGPPLTQPGSPGAVTTIPHAPGEPADCKAPPTRDSIKFSGPFSIESLLRRDSPSGRRTKPPLLLPPPPPPLRSGQVVAVETGSPGDCDAGAKRWLSWDYLPPVTETLQPGSDRRWPFHDTWSNVRAGAPGGGGGGGGGGGAPRPFKRICREPPSAPVIQQRYGLAPYVAGAQRNVQAVSRYVCDSHHFRL